MNSKKILSLVLTLLLKILSEEPCLSQSKIVEIDTICLQTSRVRLLYKGEQLYQLEKQKSIINQVHIATLTDTIRDKNALIFSKNNVISTQNNQITSLSTQLNLTKIDLTASKKRLTIIYIAIGALLAAGLTLFFTKFSIANLFISIFKKTL